MQDEVGEEAHEEIHIHKTLTLILSGRYTSDGKKHGEWIATNKTRCGDVHYTFQFDHGDPAGARVTIGKNIYSGDFTMTSAGAILFCNTWHGRFTLQWSERESTAALSYHDRNETWSGYIDATFGVPVQLHITQNGGNKITAFYTAYMNASTGWIDLPEKQGRIHGTWVALKWSDRHSVYDEFVLRTADGHHIRDNGKKVPRRGQKKNILP